MNFNFLPEAHRTEPVQTSAHGAGEWLTVAEAVSYCALKHLPRTAKTVRKWAHRSHLDPENGDIIVRREDVENGFRWTIERTSLDRKIKQELEFEARRSSSVVSEPAQTDPETSRQVRTGAFNAAAEVTSVSKTDLVRTGANPSSQVASSASAQQNNPDPDQPSEQAQTRANQDEPVPDTDSVVQQLQARIQDLKSEVEFYRDELRDRRHTTLALTDVIEAFRLTAATNASKAQERGDKRGAHDIRPTDTGDRWQGENAADDVY
jgi:hypothetical protein